MARFDGKGILVTGSASGIGAATAKRFADEGAFVAGIDVDPGGAAVVEGFGSRGHFATCDVSDATAVEGAVLAAHRWLVDSGAKLDVLFNNAGIGSVSETPDLEVEDWLRVIAVDLHSIFYGCRVAIPLMRDGGGGSIINTASISGLGGDYGFSAYNAAKGAVVNYTRTLALDHGKDGIRVNALCPGLIFTGLSQLIREQPELLDHWSEMIPLGRAGEPEEMAGIVAFLASEDASYITGATMVADGGVTARTGQPNLMQFLGQITTTDTAD